MTTEAPKPRKRRPRAHGEGGIRQRPDGRWEATYYDRLGKRTYLYGRTQAEAVEKLDRVKADLRAGMPVAGRVTLNQWLDYWLEAMVKPERAPTTYESYEILVRVHIAPYLGKIALRQLRPEDVEAWLRELDSRGVGVRTRQSALTRLRTAVNVAMRRGHAVRNVAELVEAPRASRARHEAPKLSDLQKLLDVTREDRLRALIPIAFGIGLRRGEVLGLTWGDIDFEARTLAVRRHVVRTKATGRVVREGAKTAAGTRTIMLPQLIVDALHGHEHQQRLDRIRAGGRWQGPTTAAEQRRGHVFASSIGTVMEPKQVNRYFASACRRAGLEARTYHGLRHDFGSLLLAAGVPTRVVQEMMGHASPYMTMARYQHVPDELQREAAARLDALFDYGATVDAQPAT